MLPYLAIAALGLVDVPQPTKHRKKPKPAAAQSATPPASVSAATPKEASILRQASCVLTLKGNLVRRFPSLRVGKNAGPDKISLEAPAGAPLTKEIKERFEYELPGTLEEQVEPGGKIRFRFLATADLAKEGARMTLRLVDYLEDTSGGAGGTPVVVEGMELTRVDPFVFEAEGRGRDLLPVAGQVYLRGRMQGPFPPGSPLNSESPIRPVVSNPLPPIQGVRGDYGASYLRFQGTSLWAWPNSKGPFTAAATLTYHGRTGSRPDTVNGTVDISFRVGATNPEKTNN